MSDFFRTAAIGDEFSERPLFDRVRRKVETTEWSDMAVFPCFGTR